MPIAPSLKYPYGMEKIRHAAVLFPAALFLYFGVQIFYEALLTTGTGALADIHSVAIPQGETYATLLYLASIGVEVGVIASNAHDALKLARLDSDA